MAARILFFESDLPFARAVRERLTARGAQVDVVDDGNAGLERASAQRPDLILLTIELPQMNGFLVCKKLKKSSDTQHIPVVILSSEATEEIFEQHRKLRTRAEDYLRKPIDPDALVARVATLVELSAAPVDGRLDLQDSMELEVDGMGPPSGERVDDEIDAFADSAFDALVIGEDTTDPTAIAAIPPDMRRSLEVAQAAADAKAMEAAPAPPKPPKPGSMPPPPPPRALRPSSDAEVEALREELARVRAQAEDATARLDRRQADLAKLEKEVADLRARAAKGGGISSREFLDLREALNSKDKEILDLRDQMSVRDKQMLELRDKNLGLERGRADFEDRVLELERNVADAEDRCAALTRDKESAAKRADDFKARLERAEDRAKKTEAELERNRAAHAVELERIETEAEAKVAAAQRERDDRIAALEDDRNERIAAVERDRDERLAEIASDRDTRLAEAKKEAAALAAAHAAALEAARSEAAAKEKAALDELRAELSAEEAKHRAVAAEQAASDKQKALDELRAELTRAHGAQSEELKKAHAQELGVLGRKMSETETRLAAAEEQIEDLGAERDGLRRAVEDGKAELAGARAEVEALGVIGQEHTAKIESLEAAERQLREQLSTAEGKIRGDEALLERARKAFAIGLSLLEDQRNNGSG